MTDNEKELLENFKKYNYKVTREFTDEELMEEIEEMMSDENGNR